MKLNKFISVAAWGCIFIAKSGFAVSDAPVSLVEKSRKLIQAEVVEYSEPPSHSQGDFPLINAKDLLPNRGKKVVAISEPSFGAGLDKYCRKSNFSEEIIAAGAGLKCELDSAKATLFSNIVNKNRLLI